MPLIHGKSKKSFVANLQAELSAGKPQAQALAIAYAEKRRAEKPEKMAFGGEVEDHLILQVAHDLMRAVESNDKQLLVDALRAMVLHIQKELKGK
jgi:hypothetical protein